MTDLAFHFPDLAGKTILLTGASRGIGRAIVPTLLDQGLNLILTARNAEALRELKESSSDPDRVTIFPSDLADPDARRELAEKINDAAPVLDAIVHNAAIDPRYRFSELKLDDFRQVMATNVEPIIDLSRDLLPRLKAAEHPRLVLVGSVTFNIGTVYLSAYVASKGAIVGLTRSMARELGPDHITVNCLEPGAIVVEKEIVDEARHQRIIDLQAVKRRLTPTDLEGPLCFLLSKVSGGITGQVLTVDGGLIHPIAGPDMQGAHLDK